ncbi:MAG: ATP-binding protein [Candidatus Hydrogenedentes bacterium]|nr:ATP-binding protein [Candidatus Hydrogenedentota bacterium]
MSFKRKIEILNTVRMRLTAVSAAVMMIVAAIVILLVYSQLRQALDQRLESALVGEWREFQSIYRDGGIGALEKELGFEQHTLGPNGGFMRVYDNDGLDVPSADLSPWGAVAVASMPIRGLHVDSPVLDDARGQRNQVRVRRLHGLVAPGVGVVMAYSQEDNYAVLAAVRYRFILLLGGLSVPILLGSWLLARHTMRGVEAVTQTATRIASGQLDQRVEVVGKGRELVNLANAFNSMVDHLLRVFREIRETNDNIAHDLRTPITRIRAASETLLLDPHASEGTRKIAADSVQECDNLLSAVNTMLDISEMEAGVRKLTLEDLDFRHLVEESCELFSPALAERGVVLSCHFNGAVPIQADKQLLRRAICNVLDNALKYSDDGGALKVVINSSSDMAELTVTDTGCGIAPKDLPRVFERFFRADKSRSLKGNGLGLGLVRAILSSHGGELSLSSTLGTGTTVAMRIPLKMQS